jgi:MYXO-CTERM domain-containing protein
MTGGGASDEAGCSLGAARTPRSSLAFAALGLALAAAWRRRR